MGRSSRGSSGGGRSSSSRSSSSRSSSGGMSSSGRSSKGSSSPSRSSSSPSSGFFRGPSYNRGPTFYGGGGYHRRTRSSLGCFPTSIVIIISIMLIAAFIFAMSSSNIGGIKNTTVREALPMSMSKETGYYTDTLNWIKQPAKLEKGMREFYKKTGVQPHLYIVDNMNGDSSPSNTVADKWMDEKYDELFTDEAHMMLVFLDNGNDYGQWILSGSETKTVIDDEARSIIHDYVDRYASSDLSDEEMFSTVFSKSAESIMTVYKSPWIKVIIGIIVVGSMLILIVIVTNNSRKKKEQELKENEQTIEILNTPLEDIKSYSDLENKYK